MSAMYNSLAKQLNDFKGQALIGTYLRNKCQFPERRLRSHENLQNWLDSGLIEEVPFDPSFISYTDMSEEAIKDHVWLKPTDIGLACHFIHLKLLAQQEATKNAYQEGKVDALKALAGDMAKSADVDVEDLKFTDDDDECE